MKRFALAVVIGLSLMACKAQVKVKAATAPVQEPVKEEPAKVEEPKAGEQIVLPELIEFEFNEARIKQTPKTLAALNNLAEVMKKHPAITKLRIEGHTDNVGSDRRNETLSKQRAEAVAKWLSQHEVEGVRVTTSGFGAKRPLVPNDTKEHRQTNRRTEYYVEELNGQKIDTNGNAKSDTKVAGNSTSAKSSN